MLKNAVEYFTAKLVCQVCSPIAAPFKARFPQSDTVITYLLWDFYYNMLGNIKRSDWMIR